MSTPVKPTNFALKHIPQQAPLPLTPKLARYISQNAETLAQQPDGGVKAICQLAAKSGYYFTLAREGWQTQAMAADPEAPRPPTGALWQLHKQAEFADPEGKPTRIDYQVQTLTEFGGEGTCQATVQNNLTALEHSTGISGILFVHPSTAMQMVALTKNKTIGSKTIGRSAQLHFASSASAGAEQLQKVQDGCQCTMGETFCLGNREGTVGGSGDQLVQIHAASQLVAVPKTPSNAKIFEQMQQGEYSEAMAAELQNGAVKDGVFYERGAQQKLKPWMNEQAHACVFFKPSWGEVGAPSAAPLAVALHKGSTTLIASSTLQTDVALIANTQKGLAVQLHGPNIQTSPSTEGGPFIVGTQGVLTRVAEMDTGAIQHMQEHAALSCEASESGDVAKSRAHHSQRFGALQPVGLNLHEV